MLSEINPQNTLPLNCCTCEMRLDLTPVTFFFLWCVKWVFKIEWIKNVNCFYVAHGTCLHSCGIVLLDLKIDIVN